MSRKPSPLPRSRPTVLALSAGALAAALLWAAPSQAQIKEPGNHPKYAVELEPHLLLQWDQSPFWGGEGYGLGMRASIPFLDNGPIKKINNNMAITFGLDWAHFGNSCWYWGGYAGPRPGIPNYDCSANDFWLPVALQWNFFLTPIISVFGEPGLAIEHLTWSYGGPCYNANGAYVGGVCDYSDSHTSVQPVFWGGARFLFSDSVGATVRIGWPYISAGVSILL